MKIPQEATQYDTIGFKTRNNYNKVYTNKREK